METSSSPPLPAINLFTHLYYQVAYTLMSLLPPPLDDSPAALRTRNHAAIAKVAALLPVNANEADLAAQCIAARAQAEEMLRLMRQNADDIGLVIQMNAQYGSMPRTSLSMHARLMRMQALRQKREAIDSAATEDAWALHVAEQAMLEVLDPAAERREAARPKAAPVETPAACVDRRIADNVSDNGTNSQDAAFETSMSAQPRNRGANGSGKTGLHEVLRRAMAAPPLGTSHVEGPELLATGGESPAGQDLGGHINIETVFARSDYRAASPKPGTLDTRTNYPSARGTHGILATAIPSSARLSACSSVVSP